MEFAIETQTKLILSLVDFLLIGYLAEDTSDLNLLQ